MQKILILNSGSSSIKIKIFDQKFTMILEALLEKINQGDEIGKMEVKWSDQKYQSDHHFSNHGKALAVFFDFVKKQKIIVDFESEILAIGHRVVMGGIIYKNPTLVTPQVLEELLSITHLAPLHNPASILGIQHMQKLVHKPNVVVFDTGFHQSLDEIKYLYPLPYKIYENHQIRKYGMHGISYEYTLDQFVANHHNAKPNLIIFHLGNGSSMCAIKNGKSFNTSMGLTPLAGLMMGTRCGDIDPAIATFLQRQLKFDIDEVDKLFNNQSGLKGISQKSNDMREIIDAKNEGDQFANLAFNMYVDRLVNFYCQYVNDLDNQLDGIIFTGGIGYNSRDVVEAFVKKVTISSLQLAPNWVNHRRGWEKISHQNSQFTIYISETNEELEIAKQTVALLNSQNETGKN